MLPLLTGLLALGVVSPLHAAPAPATEPCYCETETIHVDVAIMGGGSAGIYAATRLTDHKKSVIVLEGKDEIGGHAETYYDPTTGAPVNMGVSIFTNTTNIVNYLTRYNVPLTKFELSELSTNPAIQFNFATGEPVTTLPAVDAQTQGLALAGWAAQVARFPEIAYSYNLKYPVDEDLIMPFGQFLEKYNLTEALSIIYPFNQGFVQVLEIPTIYMIKYFGAEELKAFQEGFFYVSATGDTRTLYKNAAAFLGSKILYSVSGMKVTRSDDGVTIDVGSSSAGHRHIRAKKLIFAIPPTLQKFQETGFDLDSSEAEIFGKIFANGYYSVLLNNTGITGSFQNWDASKKYGVPTFPAVYSAGVVPTAPSIAQIFYGSPSPLDFNTVVEDCIKTIERIPASYRSNVTATPGMVYGVKHTPFNPMVTPEDIKDGFYKKLEAQQGQKSTWYTGGAWMTASSSVIWEGLEQEFLPKFLATF